MAQIQYGKNFGATRQWLVQIIDAQAHYRKALDDHQRMVEELDQCLADGATGSFRIARAMHAHAFNELVRRQELLVNLVLRDESLPVNGEH